MVQTILINLNLIHNSVENEASTVKLGQPLTIQTTTEKLLKETLLDSISFNETQNLTQEISRLCFLQPDARYLNLRTNHRHDTRCEEKDHGKRPQFVLLERWQIQRHGCFQVRKGRKLEKNMKSPSFILEVEDICMRIWKDLLGILLLTAELCVAPSGGTLSTPIVKNSVTTLSQSWTN